MDTRQVHDAHDIDVVMPVYSLKEFVVIVIRKHLKFFGNIAEMNQIWMLIMLLLILTQLILLLIRLKLKKK